MTKTEHIEHWKGQTIADWQAVQALFQAKLWGHSLFWAHLVLEKLLKALWVKTNEGNEPPRIHNLILLVKMTGEEFSETELLILSDMDRFQIHGRYPGFVEVLEASISKEICEEYLFKTNQLIECLQEKLH